MPRCRAGRPTARRSRSSAPIRIGRRSGISGRSILETGALRQITRRTYGQPWGGSWFPDGQRIAYSHEDRLIVHDLRTGSERVFRTPKSGHLVRTPAVSPDGRRIMFQVHHDGAWMLELGDSSMRRILEDPTAEEYTWAPDGRRVAYHSRKSGEWGVWVMAARVRVPAFAPAGSV
jgi:Tol biopolymer transport system component